MYIYIYIYREREIYVYNTFHIYKHTDALSLLDGSGRPLEVRVALVRAGVVPIRGFDSNLTIYNFSKQRNKGTLECHHSGKVLFVLLLTYCFFLKV